MLETGKRILGVAPDIILRGVPEFESYWAFDVESGEQFRLSESSYWILGQCDGTRTLSSIFDEFLARYEVESAVAQADFTATIDSLIKDGIVKEVEENAGEEKICEANRGQGKEAHIRGGASTGH